MSDMTGTWPLWRTNDNWQTSEDSGQVAGPCLYSQSWAVCAGLEMAHEGWSYQPRGEYHAGIDSGVPGAPLVEPDPAIADFHGVATEAGRWVQALTDNSDPRQSYGCNLVAPG